MRQDMYPGIEREIKEIVDVVISHSKYMQISKINFIYQNVN